MGIITGTEKVAAPVEILVINAHEIREVLTYKDVLEAADESWKASGTGEIDIPPQIAIPIGQKDKGNFALGHPAYLKTKGPRGNLGTLGEKWGTLFQHPKSRRTQPKMWGSIVVLNQADNGQPFAIMDGIVITNLRTAGHSAIAAKHLAKKDSRKLAMIGCGAEARTHLALYIELFPIEVVKVYAPRRQAIDDYKEEMSKLFKVQIIPAASAREAVEGVDIICMVTSAEKPVVLESWVPVGCLAAIAESPEERLKALIPRHLTPFSI